jgi:hypothetical protein
MKFKAKIESFCSVFGILLAYERHYLYFLASTGRICKFLAAASHQNLFGMN